MTTFDAPGTGNEELGVIPPRPRALKKKGARSATKVVQAQNHVSFGYKLAADSEQPYDDFKGDGNVESPASKIRFATAKTLRAALSGNCSVADVERIVAHAAVTVVSKNGGPATSTVRSLVAGGQVRYLKTLREIIETVTQADIAEAIVGPWHYRKASKTSMDPNSLIENIGQEITALGAVSALGAERLAIEGLRSLPTAPHGRYLVTRCFLPRSFRWCLWEGPLSLEAIRVLLGRVIFMDRT